MKNTAQDGQLADISWVCLEQTNGIKTITADLTRLFQENITQIVFFKISGDRLAGWCWRSDGRSQRVERLRLRKNIVGGRCERRLMSSFCQLRLSS